jgi:uncharacterized membrane-anchored protein
MRVKFLLIVCLQALLLSGIIAYRQHWIDTGEKIVLKTTPMDPRDPFRGDYVNLTYEITSITIDSECGKPDFLPGQPIYLELGTDADGASYPTAINKEVPAGGTFIRGRVRSEYTESKWDVKLRDDSGQVHDIKPPWFQGMKTGDKITVCLDEKDAVLFYNKENTPYTQACLQNNRSLHGAVEDITETKTRKVYVDYGIESYFVEEGKGIQLDQVRNVQGPIRVEVALRKDGKGIISRLMPVRSEAVTTP